MQDYPFQTCCQLDLEIFNEVYLECHCTLCIDGQLYRGSYLSAHVLLKLLNELKKRGKCEACRAFHLFFATSLINSIKQEHACEIFLSYDIKITLKSHFCRKNLQKYTSKALVDNFFCQSYRLCQSCSVKIVLSTSTSKALVDKMIFDNLTDYL